jgi:hypothetical protein
LEIPTRSPFEGLPNDYTTTIPLEELPNDFTTTSSYDSTSEETLVVENGESLLNNC